MRRRPLHRRNRPATGPTPALRAVAIAAVIGTVTGIATVAIGIVTAIVTAIAGIETGHAMPPGRDRPSADGTDDAMATATIAATDVAIAPKGVDMNAPRRARVPGDDPRRRHEPSHRRARRMRSAAPSLLAHPARSAVNAVNAVNGVNAAGVAGDAVDAAGARAPKPRPMVPRAVPRAAENSRTW